MRTRLSAWQVNDRKERDQMKYVETKYITASQAGHTNKVYRIPFPEGIGGVMVQTIRVEAEDLNQLVVVLNDGSEGYRIYESLEETKFHYDQISVPYKPDDQAYYVQIENRSAKTTKFHIDIKGIEVK